MVLFSQEIETFSFPVFIVYHSNAAGIKNRSQVTGLRNNGTSFQGLLKNLIIMSSDYLNNVIGASLQENPKKVGSYVRS